jgi:zinc transporter, ZIP family
MHGGTTQPVSSQLVERRPHRGAGTSRHALAAAPVLGLLAVVAVLLVVEPIRSLTETTPVDSLAVERTTLAGGRVELHVRNDGRSDLTIAQVLVNHAYWAHTASDRHLARFDSATVALDYPWEDGVPLHIAVLTASGTVIEHDIDNPSATPELDRSSAATLGLVGLLVAPVPIALGLAWLPALRRSSGAALAAAMAFTLGLLAFLLVDSTAEGLEAAAEAPQAVDGVGLFAVGALVAVATVAATGTIGRRSRHDGARGAGGAVRLAWLVAAGIGLHNLGEGLAVGTALSTGEVALGTALVVGFAVHNLTEGVAIAGPLGAATPAGAARLAGLVAVAGLPVFVGLWLGGFVLPAGWAALAFGVAAGAVAEVVWAVGSWLRDRGVVLSPMTAGAFCGAVVLLYATGIVTA